MIRFLQEVRGELVKVTWPPRNEVIRLTAVVIIISVFFGIYLGSLDFIFTNMLKLLVE